MKDFPRRKESCKKENNIAFTPQLNCLNNELPWWARFVLVRLKRKEIGSFVIYGLKVAKKRDWFGKDFAIQNNLNLKMCHIFINCTSHDSTNVYNIVWYIDRESNSNSHHKKNKSINFVIVGDIIDVRYTKSY